MALITCPECAHEVSTAANSCPNCGFTFVKPVVQRNVVVAEAPPESDGFPKWIFIPLGILGVVLLFILLAYMRNRDDETATQRNVNVNIATQQSSANSRDTTTRNTTAPNEIVVPPSTTGQVVVPPQTSAPVSSAPDSSTSTTTTTVQPDTVASTKGTVKLEAKIATKTGGSQPVRAERFYLLDKDLQSILNEADIDDESGQGLTNAFGLSIVYPNKYGETNKKAMNAISKHIVYRTQTDASGKATIKDIEPDTYYLFGVTKTGNGFVIWSSPVTIQPGENPMILPPASITEIVE